MLINKNVSLGGPEWHSEIEILFYKYTISKGKRDSVTKQKFITDVLVY